MLDKIDILAGSLKLYKSNPFSLAKLKRKKRDKIKLVPAQKIDMTRAIKILNSKPDQLCKSKTKTFYNFPTSLQIPFSQFLPKKFIKFYFGVVSNYSSF